MAFLSMVRQRYVEQKMSCRKSARVTILQMAEDLKTKANQLAILRSVDATESARWLESVASKLHELVSQDTEASMASPPGEGEAKPVIKRFGAGEPETLNGFAEKYGLQILVKERSSSLNRDGRLSSGVKFTRYMASLRRQSDSAIVEVMENGMLCGKSGNGDTIEEAASDLARSLAGNRVAIGAYGPDRKNVDVPNDFRHEVKPPASELDELRGRLAAAEGENGSLATEARRLANVADAALRRATSAESALAASEQAREGMAKVVEAAKAWRKAGIGLGTAETSRDLALAVDALASPPAEVKFPAGFADAAAIALSTVPGVDAAYIYAGTREDTIFVVAREHGLVDMGVLLKIENDLRKNYGEVDITVRAHQGRDPDMIFDKERRLRLSAPSPVPAAPPQAETGGEGLTEREVIELSCYAPNLSCVVYREPPREVDETRRRAREELAELIRSVASLQATVAALTSERDAMRVQLEAAGVLEKPEDAWLRSGHVHVGDALKSRALRDGESGCVTIREYEPPTVAK